ncbi:hypothetical protein CBR_g63078 [Chara braunii]|uniref:Reverse transcriptase zinc-binding domain-containing protein n=1 Tax=Chara braunii TaxID=69332 RepID=A0A388K8W8_CHABU|nr:hypothetical protein CBR_g63078 [Chara braunii]|eukprot:GBG66495.1 hypothetical protein CBR_g63078 [Chara braunii]
MPDGQQLKSGAFADDTAAVTETTQSSVDAIKHEVVVFEQFAGARINWSKSIALTPPGADTSPLRGMMVQEENRQTKYLCILLPGALTTGEQMEELLHEAVRKMTDWSKGASLGIMGRILVANNAVSSTLWYVRAVSSPSKKPWKDYKIALRRFIWRNDPQAHHLIYRVRWEKLTQPRSKGGLGLLTALHMRTILWLLLEDDKEPWKMLTIQLMAEAIRVHPADVDIALLHPKPLRGLKKDALWTATLEKWREQPLQQAAPRSCDHILQQTLFGNRLIISTQGDPFPWQDCLGSFGRQWLTCGIYRVVDLWDLNTGTWKLEVDILNQLRHQPAKEERLHQIKTAIPQEWVDLLHQGCRLKNEWVVKKEEGTPTIFFTVQYALGNEWYYGKAWETVLTTNPIGQPLVRCSLRDGMLHKDTVRSVSVLKDYTFSSTQIFRPYRPWQTPLQLSWDPSVWEWGKANSLSKPQRIHQVTTKIMYRAMNPPTDMADEMRLRWLKRQWVKEEDVTQWTQSTWELACQLLTMLPDQKQAGELWLSLQLAQPTYQWMTERSSYEDSHCRHCHQQSETLPHIWLDCAPQSRFWEWWQSLGPTVPLATPTIAQELRPAILLGQLLAGQATTVQTTYAAATVRAALWAAAWAMRIRELRTGKTGSFHTRRAWMIRNLKVSLMTDVARRKNGGWRFLQNAWAAYGGVVEIGTEVGEWRWKMQLEEEAMQTDPDDDVCPPAMDNQSTELSEDDSRQHTQKDLFRDRPDIETALHPRHLQDEVQPTNCQQQSNESDQGNIDEVIARLPEDVLDSLGTPEYDFSEDVTDSYC